MMMQQTPEWHAARLGKLTASRYSDAMSKTKTGWGAMRERYIAELVTERLTGISYPSYVSPEMRWGTETQPLAMAAYSFLRDVDVTEVGFVDHPRIAMSGASPDGLIGDDGLVEFKCPATHTHVSILRGAPIPIEYVMQMQWQLICTGRQWCDWVSFDPRLLIELQMHIRRVRLLPTAAAIVMERDAVLFLENVSRVHEELEGMRYRKEAA